MSILNAWVRSSYALVGVDSEAVAPDGQVKSLSKMFPLVHGNMVLSGRGHWLFLSSAYCACAGAGGDFDSMVDKLPELLQQCFDSFMATAPILAIPNLPSAPLQVQEIVLIGPSTRLGRMHGYSFIRHDEEGFIADAIDPLYSAPTHSQLDDLRLPDPDSPLTMLALARAQVAFLHRMAPGVAAGGRLVLCEITKHEMRIWCAGDLSITTSTS